MSSDLDDFVNELQEQILEDTREAYGNVAYERWLNPLYRGRMEEPDGYGILTGHCGDTMKIFLKFAGNTVVDASFDTDGCGASAVCGSFAAEMAIGKTPDELLDVTGEAILERLGGLPETEEHCAFLAGETLQEALNTYMKKERRKAEGTEHRAK
jgi:nitrogen fixation NifU-like protein